MSGNFLSCIKGVKDPFEAQEGRRDFSRDAAGEGPHLLLRGESPGFSRAVSGSLGFLSCYDGDLRDPIMWPQGSPVSMRVASGL